jgi:peroxiredoxin Q/BCP
LTAESHGRIGEPVLSIGDTAPDFSGTDQHGMRVSLDELLKESAVVLYFYPKDFTPVCTAQACMFRDTTAELSAAGARVVGVSGDDQNTHSRFAETHKVPFSLLSDPDKSIQKSYEARQLLGLLTKRVTYVIDRNKKIRGVFHHELSAQKHIDAVKKMLSSMSS